MKKNMLRAACSIMLVAVLLGISVIVGAAGSTGVVSTPGVNSLPQEKMATLTVFTTTDVHGHILGWDYNLGKPEKKGGLAKVMTLLEKERGKANYSILLDAGDFLQGTPLTSYYATVNTKWNVHPAIAAFNLMKYDAIAVGNHEFNYGADFLRRAINDADFPVVSANIIDTETGKNWSAVKPYTVVQMMVEGKKLSIGIISTVTKAIPLWESPEHYKGLMFADQVKTVRAVIDAIKKDTDIIILITHSGVEIPGAGIDGENQAAAIAKACPEISLIVAGHEHILLDNEHPVLTNDKKVLYPKSVVNGVPVIEAKCFGEYLGKAELTLYYNGENWHVDAVKTQNIPVEGLEDAAEMVRVIAPYQKDVIDYLQTKIGVATESFVPAASWRDEWPLITFVNDVQRYYSKAQLSAAAVFNPDATIQKGDITLQNMYALYNYENYLASITITGKQLRQYLEHAALFYNQAAPGDRFVTVGNEGIPAYNYDMVVGVDYIIDTTKEAGKRIYELKYNGKNVQDGDTFTLALNNYRLSGGGGYMKAIGFDAVRDAKLVNFDSQKLWGDEGQIRSLLVKYIKEKETITPGFYRNITVTTDPIDTNAEKPALMY